MNEPSTKPKITRAAALIVAKEICDALKPHTTRLIVAGSLRRMKDMVGDVEILYVPRITSGPDPADLFSMKETNQADEAIAELEAAGIISKRLNVAGHTMFGPKNKLMIHERLGVPIDLFAATDENWWNYLVCRTGPADSNTAIATAAQRKGWKWHPYGTGFSNPTTGEVHTVTSEEAVFAFVGLPYHEPKDRQ